MPYPCTDDPNEILEYVGAAKSNAQKFSTFVNGTASQTVQLGEGEPTPSLRKFIADAQSVVATAANDAAETVLGDVADMKLSKADKRVPLDPMNVALLGTDGGLRDSKRTAGDFASLLACADGGALDLIWKNRVNIDDGYDGSIAQRRLQANLLGGNSSASKPVFFLISGQSNAVGAGVYTPFDSAEDFGTFWAWPSGANELQPIKDPIGTALSRGSGWCAFARRFASLTGRKVMLLDIAVGGAAVTDGGYTTTNTWADNGYGTLRAARGAVWNAFSAAVPASSYDVGGIIWIQGETEANRIYAGTVSVQDYKNGTLDVLNWTRGLLGDQTAPVFFSKTGFSLDCLTNSSLKAAYENVQAAQESMCASNSTLHMAFEMAPFFALPDGGGWSEYMSDPNHYSRLGYKILGNGLARSIARILQLV